MVLDFGGSCALNLPLIEWKVHLSYDWQFVIERSLLNPKCQLFCFFVYCRPFVQTYFTSSMRTHEDSWGVCWVCCTTHVLAILTREQALTWQIILIPAIHDTTIWTAKVEYVPPCSKVMLQWYSVTVLICVMLQCFHVSVLRCHSVAALQCFSAKLLNSQRSKFQQLAAREKSHITIWVLTQYWI